MNEGYVKAIKLEKGFGFIAQTDGPDIFFHANELIELAWDEQLLNRRVKFNVITNPRGLRAVGVQAAA